MIRKIVLFVLILAAGMAAGALLYSRLAMGKSGHAGGERKILYYVDPMHPSYRSDKPGIAPDCGMALEPVYADGGPSGGAGQTATAPHGERKILYYVDPMHPSYKSDKPGIAPDCGMALEPVYADGAPGATPAAGSSPPGTVYISADKRQLIGVKYGEVKTLPLARTIRTVGKVAYDETKIARIHTKIEGWIEEVSVDFTGKLVKQGQPLLSIYSPELLATQQEFLLARRAVKSLGDSPVKEISAGAESLYAAARKRLELWDVSEEQIEEVLKRNEPIKTMKVFSPATGYVLSKNAFPKQRVTPETELYSIADLSTVWVMADIYEYEAPAVRVGQTARMTLSYYPGEVFRGTVTYIYPQVEAATRTLKARIEFPNSDLRLKPDMFANVELVVDHGRKLAVPEEAVMNSGLESRVFIDRHDGHLEPRTVELGEKVGNHYVVLKGLKEGDRVVTSGNFLVDSESRLKSAVTAMSGAGHQHGSSPAPAAPVNGSPAPTQEAPATAPPAKQPHPAHPPGHGGH